MRLKPIAITFGLLVLGLRFYLGNHDEADSKLETFYTQVVATDFSGARKSIDAAIDLWPADARYYDWRGYLSSQNLPPTCRRSAIGIEHGLKKEDRTAILDAIEDYRRAIVLNSRDAVAHQNVAWLEHLLGDDKRAAENWETAIAIDPGSPIFHVSFGMFLDETGEKSRADEEYETAIDLSPSTVDSQYFARYHSRDSVEASSVVAAVVGKLEKQLQRAKDPIIEARLGKLYLFQDDLSRASRLLEDAAQQLPNLPLVWMNLGDVRKRQGNLAAAMGYYRKANFIDPSLAGPYLRMGEIELLNGLNSAATGDFSRAIQQWQRVKPITAAHNNRLYVGPRQKIDDLLPTTLVWYTTPCEASKAWQGLSQLFPGKREYAQRTHTCEDLPSPHSQRVRVSP